MAERCLRLLVALGLIALGGTGPCPAARAEELRDPFTFGPRAGERQGASPVLLGILWDANRPLAVVGDREVGVGDSVVDWQIAEIRQDSLVLQRGTQQVVVRPGDAFPP